MTRRCFAVAALVLSLALAGTGIAQVATTSLRGVIKDPSGAVVPGAKVTLSNGATGQQFSATSNAAGEYTFAQIPPARYTITATAAGFGEQSKVAELLVNQPATVDFTMTVKAVAQVVNVSAEAQTLNTTDASLGNSEGNALIQALPSETRNVPDLLSLQPGVLYLPTTVAASEQNPLGDSRSGAVNGVRSDQGNVTVDGVDDNDQVYGYAFTGVLRETQDSIEEFRVTTANANADQGRSAGAQVNLITKSGTNKFHGAAYEYNRPTLTVSNDFFNKQGELNSGEPNIPPKLIRNIFGVAVGGPIRKDKLFFFANYEGTRQAEDAEVNQVVATAPYKEGILQYQGDEANGSITNVTLTPTQVAQLDSGPNGCVAQGGCETTQYPLGPGPNPYALAYFNAMPTANSNACTGTCDGLNTGAFIFASPNPQTQNTTIGKIDYTPTQSQHIFVRGDLQKDTILGTEEFPGQGPSSVYEDNTKGIIAGDTWTISPNLVNDIRYGYIRQGNSSRGVGVGDYVDFRFMASPTAETRTTIAWVPVNNIVDNLNWNKGRHDFQFGVNWRLVQQNRVSNGSSYNVGSTNPYWLGGSPPDPSSITGLPVDSGFDNSWVIAYGNLVGDVPDVTDQYNYDLTSPTSGNLLADGAFLNRHFKANEYESYLQDAWRPTDKLTITLGVRYTILQTPWETSGQEVTPTIDTHAWYQERETAALQGQIYEPELTFAPAGPYYKEPGFWPKSKDNFAPRFAIAYAPTGKTTIRMGAGLYYDHYGESLINLFDQSGAYGLSGGVEDPASTYDSESAPRFTTRNALPFTTETFPTQATYPFTPPTGPTDGFAITWGLDSRMKTPYTEAFNLSVQHEFPHGFMLETDYVGTLGRHLLQALDLAEPVDYVDPNGGGDYFSAGTKLSRLVDQNNGNYEVNGNYSSPAVPAIPYFENVFSFMQGYDYPGESATQAIYNNEWAPYRYNLGATSSLSDLDFYGPLEGFYPAPSNWQPHFWQGQFSSLYALSTMGMSYYNAGQIILRHPVSHGLQLDISYTLSRSIDEGSDAERSTEFSASKNLEPGILNTWKPALNRGVSSFDTHHLLTVDGVYQLPFGRGRTYLSGINKVEDTFLGGWQLSGINRTTSGLPFSLFEPGFTTNWQQESYAVVTGPVKMRRHLDSNFEPQYFDNPGAINTGVTSGSPIRLPYPGEAGERDNFRGDGYFDIDTGLDKSWQVADYGTLKFSWETYNVTNTVRFDPQSIGSGLTDGNLGIASTLLTVPRRMQFALRFDF